LEYLHYTVNIVHRDLKPDNLLIDEMNRLKLVDFGSAHSIREGDLVTNTSGTYAFMAPEVFTENKHFHARPLDIWAAGVTLYYILFDKIPFEGKRLTELTQSIINDELDIPNGVSLD
jgi:[calcium/calmodulin-dependent protein kinase] kinase